MILQEVIMDLDKLIEKSNAKIEFKTMPVIIGFHLELNLLFQNLISNAIKYQNENQRPIIEISFEEKELEWEFKVKDNGIGFEMRYQEKIFEMFQRLHAKNEYEGTGIGLAICKKIIDNHEGYIQVSSILGKGSTFTIYLPIKL